MFGTGARDRGGGRLLPAVRRPVRRAAIHPRRRRPGGVAEPAPAAVRRHRHRSPGGAPGRAGQRRDPAGRRIARAVPDQPDAHDDARAWPMRCRSSSRTCWPRPGWSGSGSPARRPVARSWSPTPATGPRPSHRIHIVLTRTPGDQPARWVQEHRPRDRSGDDPPDPEIGPLPDDDLGRRRGARIDLGDASARGGRPRSRGDAAAEPRRRPGRAGVPPRAPGRDGECGGDRPPGRGAEGRPARFGLARVPDAARDHPRRRRQPARPGRRRGPTSSVGRPPGRSMPKPSDSTCSCATCST